MCTLSWTHYGDNHYEVYFNRDEQRTRLAAIEPQNFVIDNINCVMPIDSAAGGSWISTNQFGVTICLLNYYQGQAPLGTLNSRGFVVKMLASSQSSREVKKRLLQMDLRSFAPFTLVSFDLNRAKHVIAWTWDGTKLTHSIVTAPVISASQYYEDAREYRTALYEKLCLSTNEQELGARFHLSVDKDYPHLSPLMSRQDARTVSFTSVSVCTEHQAMHYQSIDINGCVDFEIEKKCLMTNMTEQGVFK
ncbi:hypothetical protein GCM10007938_24590 [Vibrio zhanjiangensis]|uniref:NRDE family protein n=1 Tax=Vibrio zhanjiangensis TaxID=1046128 RepID=A0ABQ6EZL3_9VIBR|nr:NRDE family protein [Vibrio zhanjiangensis]GLT18678.1 hypothetical protein GCM10007938_24590 [Vibrio zhanjiangensis]